jgi:hypothetical protein
MSHVGLGAANYTLYMCTIFVASTVKIGDEVQGKWIQNGRWYDAVVSELLPDGNVLVDWLDQDEEGRRLRVDDQVRPRAVQFWVQCDSCEMWRSITKEHTGGPFSCSDIYKNFGCSELPDEFYAFDRKKLQHELKSATQEGALEILRRAFSYLLDKLPRHGLFLTKTKTNLLEGLETATLLEIEARLLEVRSDLVPRFRAEDWAQSWSAHFAEFEPPSQRDTEAAPLDVCQLGWQLEELCQLGWQLEELIEWGKIAEYRRAKRKAKRQPSARARARLLRTPSGGRSTRSTAARVQSE